MEETPQDKFLRCAEELRAAKATHKKALDEAREAEDRESNAREELSWAQAMFETAHVEFEEALTDE